MFICRDDYILVKPIVRKKSDVIEVISNEKFNRGLVVAVGTGRRIRNSKGVWTGKVRPMQVKVGDWITYVDLDHIYPVYFEREEEFRILQEDDITFISDREFIDAHNSLSDAEIERLISEHNKPLEIAA